MSRLRKCPLFLAAMALMIGLAVWQVAAPDRLRSDMENRPLAQWKAPTLSTIASGRWMQDTESYVADQFAGRDNWMLLQAMSGRALLQTKQNGILLGKSGWMFEECDNLALGTATDAMQAVETMAAKLDVPVTAMIVPMSSAVYEHLLPTWYTPDDQQAIIDGLYEQMPSVQAVDVLSALRSPPNPREMLYFQTDHHWTQFGARVGYAALMDAWGMEAESWPYERVEGGQYFFGTYYARAPQRRDLGDTLFFDAVEGVTLTIGGDEMDGLYDPVQMDSRDQYAALLWGNSGQLTLESDAAGGTLLVIRDSYADMLLPLLAQHFSRIEAVDLRYFAGDLPGLIEETEADQILCLYGLTTLLTDRNLPLFAAAWDE